MKFFFALFLSWVIISYCEGRTIFSKICSYFDSSSVDIAAQMIRKLSALQRKLCSLENPV